MNIKLNIPESFYKGEELCGYYVSPEMKKVWAVELDLLSEFSRVCEKHGIRWWIDAGTLLGAVRHKGFIPWDDDVDVMLMRADYDKFCAVAPQEFRQPYLFQSEGSTGGGSWFRIARLYNSSTTMMEQGMKERLEQGMKIPADYPSGVFMDIFPLEDVPDDELDFMRLYRKLRQLFMKGSNQRYYSVNYYPAKKLWKRPVKFAVHCWLKMLDIDGTENLNGFLELMKSINYPDSKQVAKFCQMYDPKFLSRRIWERSDFHDTVMLPFEMLTLPAPSGYVNILNKFYGNWHEYFIRARHADFYDTEHSYTYYTQEGHLPNEKDA